jgi:hypothetical protein
MRVDSDVDVVVILRTDQYLPAVYELTKRLGNTTHPPFQAGAFTLEELQRKLKEAEEERDNFK